MKNISLQIILLFPHFRFNPNSFSNRKEIRFQLFSSVGIFTSVLIISKKKKNIAVARVHKVLPTRGPETDFGTQFQQQQQQQQNRGRLGGKTFSDPRTGNKLLFTDGPRT